MLSNNPEFIPDSPDIFNRLPEEQVISFGQQMAELAIKENEENGEYTTDLLADRLVAKRLQGIFHDTDE